MRILSILFGICIVYSGSAFSEESNLKNVQARTLELTVPKTWVKKATTSQMRAAEFSIPGAQQDAELVVYYFGGPTGGVKANVDRWIGQFEKDGLELSMFQGECRAGKYILVDTKGTWNKPDGPPFASKTIATPGSRVVNVIVIEKKEDAEDYYFLKLSGNKETVDKQTDALRTAIGAKLETEKTFEMKDAS